mmetsp:Transcript_1476/g.2597  ORF Transcript_1476/g.2597 Transcript_1476/m.2597 type:complete len:281 (+) Transcript_1476:23-865(+)
MVFNRKESMSKSSLLLSQPHSESHVFKISHVQLQEIFSNGFDRKVKTILEEHGHTHGIIRKLASDPHSGITGDDRDLLRRIQVFGENVKILPQIPGILDSLKQQCQDKMWWAIIGSAFVLSVFEGFFTSLDAMMQGVSIIFGTVFIILILSVADYLKDSQFVKLQSILKDQDVQVIRGKMGEVIQISAWNLVVGDVIQLGTGERVPADCLVIEHSDLQVSIPEHLENKSEDAMDVNDELTEGPRKVEDERVLFADSFIKRGHCKALVCSVGENSSRFEAP